jgi:NADPH:quinone reductase
LDEIKPLQAPATRKKVGLSAVFGGYSESQAWYLPDGVDHIVEVAFGANVDADVELLKNDGSIATYATDNSTPNIPFWQMVFKNIRVYFLGSDDFPREAKMQAALDINSALEAGWTGFEIGERIPLAEIARAHELVDHPSRRGRVVVSFDRNIFC